MIKKLQNSFRLIQRYRHYLTTTPEPPLGPTRVWLEPTSHCNFKCPLCPNPYLPRETQGYMELDFYRDILNQLKPSIYDLNLFHRGESLMHPDILEMVEIAKQMDIYVRLHTNASLLTKDMSENLIRSGLDFISFSFDGFEKETYEKNRLNGKFEKTLDNVIGFLKTKQDLGSDTPYSVLQAIDYFPEDQINKITQQKFLEQFKGLPLDRSVIRQAHNWAGLVDIETNGNRPLEPIPCTFLWYSLTICWDGKVSPCPQDFFEELIVGDLKKESLDQIWNGPKMVGLRKRFKNRDIDFHPCKTCDRIWRPTVLGIPVDYVSAFVKDNLFAYND